VRSGVVSPNRDMGRADSVAVGDGGETLDVGAEQSPEHLRLGLAQLGELGRDVGDRAVVLAELFADRRAARRSSVPVRAQGLGQGFGALLGGGGLDAPGNLGRPRARVYQMAYRDMTVVMVVDKSLDL